MSVLMRLLVLSTCFGVVGCGNGPFGLMSGGPLDGEVRPVPDSWAFVGSSGTAQLETNPQAPYSVNLNYTLLDGSLYINAGGNEAAWVKHIAANPAVRLRIDGVIYELHADRVTDPEEMGRFGKAWTSQSRFMNDPAEMDEAWVYRLRAR